MHLRFLLPALLGALLLGGSARADFQYQFTDSSGTASSAFTVNAGSTVDIRVYLLQTGSSTNLSANGLVDGGVSLSFSATAPFTVASTSNITPNSAFGGPNNTSLTTSGGTTTATVQVHNNSPILAPTGGADANRILLGTFTFTGLTAGTAVTLTALPDPSTQNNIDGLNNVLDSMVHNSQAAITVNAVPEPSTLVLTGLLACGFAGAAARRYRRRVVA
jgi:hypothetical protein